MVYNLIVTRPNPIEGLCSWSEVEETIGTAYVVGG